MQAKTIKGKSPEEIEFALLQSITDNFKPTLAIVFLSVKQNIRSHHRFLQKIILKFFVKLLRRV